MKTKSEGIQRIREWYCKYTLSRDIKAEDKDVLRYFESYIATVLHNVDKPPWEKEALDIWADYCLLEEEIA